MLFLAPLVPQARYELVSEPEYTELLDDEAGKADGLCAA